MRRRGFALLVLVPVVLGCRRNEDDDGGESTEGVSIPTGTYEVTRTTESPDDCEAEGSAVEGGVHFFRIDGAIRAGYRATTCGGDVEPDCPTRDSYVGDASGDGWQQLDFSGTMEEDAAGNPVCRVSASLLRLESAGASEARYETARWEADVVEAPDACGEDLARTMYDAGELDCVEHTTRTGTLRE